MPNANLAVGYVRVSRDDQRLSPAAQTALLERYAAERGLVLVAVALDLGVCSADAADERPGLSHALDLVREHRAAVLLVAKRDRLARDVYVTASVERMLAQGGAHVESASGEGNGDSPADAFMRTVVDGAAQYERALIRSRTKAALAVKRSRGERTTSKLPYGYALGADGKHLVSVEREVRTMARARALRASGLSFAAIASALTAEGYRARNGSPFVAMQIARMMPEENAA